MQGLEDLEALRSRIVRAKAWRAEHLEQLRRTDPKLFEAAEALNAEMRKAVETAPFPDPRDDGSSFEATHEAVEKLTKRLAEIEPQVAFEALAMDWLDTTKGHWSGDEYSVWGNAVRDAFRDREKEVATLQKNEAERLLLRAGLSKTQVAEYIAAVDSGFGRSPEFPLDPPNGYRLDKLSPEIATTDFILRCETYDRGAIYLLYGMWGERLAKILPARVQDRIPSMLSSPDGDAWVAARLIEEVKGFHFVDEVLRRQVAGERPGVFLFLNADDKNWKTDVLNEMFKRARTGYSLWGRSRLWDSLGTSGIDDPVCIGAAIADLENEEKAGKRTEDEERWASGFRDSLRRYLTFAQSARSAQGDAKKSAAEWNEWFEKNPAPAKK
ncbi:MAG: hypothetical protein AAB074_21190 [Planctomycetota bacterium]